MDKVRYFSCYIYNEEWNLIEMLVDAPSNRFFWGHIHAPEEGVPRSSWQAPYLEQYLNGDGTDKICKLYREPSPAVQPTRVAFFLYKTGAVSLHTLWGDFDISDPQPLPERLSSIIEFENEEDEYDEEDCE